MSEQNIITFIDHIGRTILGLLVEETKDAILVKNPAIIHVQPTQQGQLNVQTIPLYFREFIGDKSKNETTWKYNKSSIVLGVNIDNDSRLIDQYHKLFAATVPATAAGESNEKVIKLFDE